MNETGVVDGCYTADCVNGTSLNTTDQQYIPHTQRPETYIVPIVFFVIFVIGCLGNGSLLFFFFRYPQMRKPPNTYIFSLALGDLLVIIFCVPFVSTIYTTESWPFGDIVCRLSEGMRDLSVGVTVFTLTALSAERYLAITAPVSRRAVNHSALNTTLLIWVASILLAFPGAILSSVRYMPVVGGDIAICFPFPPVLGENYPKIVVMAKFILFYALPLTLISTFYCLMARHLILTAAALPGEASKQWHKMSQITARRKVAKMVLTFVFLFAVCFIPNHIFLLWFYFSPTAEQDYNVFWNVFRIVGFCLAFANSCINPVALYCVSGTFRKYFNHHLFCYPSCGDSLHDRSLTQLRFHSSAAAPTTNTRTEQIDMSTFNGHEKNVI